MRVRIRTIDGLLMIDLRLDLLMIDLLLIDLRLVEPGVRDPRPVLEVLDRRPGCEAFFERCLRYGF